jgi:hypothetical protein
MSINRSPIKICLVQLLCCGGEGWGKCSIFSKYWWWTNQMAPSGKRQGKNHASSRTKNSPENLRLFYPTFFWCPPPGLVYALYRIRGGWSVCFREQCWQNKEPHKEPPVILCPPPRSWRPPKTGAYLYREPGGLSGESQNKSRSETRRLFCAIFPSGCPPARPPARPRLAKYENWGWFECFCLERYEPPVIISHFPMTCRIREGGYEKNREKRKGGGGGGGTRTRFLLLRLSVLTSARPFF